MIDRGIVPHSNYDIICSSVVPKLCGATSKGEGEVILHIPTFKLFLWLGFVSNFKKKFLDEK